MTVLGIALAALAFVLALPPFANMFFGGPSIELIFERTVENGRHFLPIYIKNRPVAHLVLRLLRVHRSTVQGLTASFRITEVGSGKILIPIRQAYIVTDAVGEMMQRITLPPTYSVGATIVMIGWDTGKDDPENPEGPEGVIIIPGPTSSKFSLPQGIYQAGLLIIVDGEPWVIKRHFVVGERPEDLNWVKETTVSRLKHIKPGDEW